MSLPGSIFVVEVALLTNVMSSSTRGVDPVGPGSRVVFEAEASGGGK